MTTPVIEPRKLDDVIARRLVMIQDDIASVQARAKGIDVKGDHPVFRELQFQRDRQALLLWMQGVSTIEIDARRLQLEAELGQASKLKYGSMHGLPADLVERIAFVELLEYCLGVHPCQLRDHLRHG